MTEPPCPFCTIDAQRVFYTGEVVIGIWDAFPVSAGHALLLPKRHVASWFDATAQERTELAEATAVAREAILERNARENLRIPDGFNIGVNVGESAGQTVFHLHVHVIPRYRGDVLDPRGGVRHVIPDKANYLATIDAAGLVRDADGSYRRTGYLPIARDRLVTGGLDDALLRPLLDDLDALSHVDIAVAFVLESGVDLIDAHLREVLERGGAVRFLTGDYMDATDPRALRRLLDLEGNIRAASLRKHRREFSSEGIHLRSALRQRGRVRRQLQPHQAGADPRDRVELPALRPATTPPALRK